MDLRALDLLSRPIVGQLSYLGLDGHPRVVPVWFEHRDGQVLVPSAPGTYKGRCLRADGRASLAVSTERWPYHLVTVRGEVAVEVLPEAARIELVGGLARRYLGEQIAARYLETWSQGGHPGDGDLLRLRPSSVRFVDISGGS
ncbi:MAG TPA: pyridoxamine 5'-phosphate oxidase family protein [Candidatus Dormibacteraeota bacterium]|nr:pyridoxamine 5'-phosphate oxidase family protein [Candidatus Dormibacteraeota bacterium]